MPDYAVTPDTRYINAAALGGVLTQIHGHHLDVAVVRQIQESHQILSGCTFHEHSGTVNAISTRPTVW